MKSITIGNIEIGKGRTYIIAEIGSNHTRDLEIAYATIDAAVDAGVDAVKFQSLQLNELYLNPSDYITELHRKIDLPENWHRPLKEYCDKKGVHFFSAPTYLSSVDILEETGVLLYKLASAQIGTFPQIIRKVAKLGKPVIISTGLVTEKSLAEVVELFREAGNDKLIILHCNSIYPAPYNRISIPLIERYSKSFEVLTGFSDHTEDFTAAIAAVSKGACVLEKHFTLSRLLPTPDAPFALEPDEMKAYVSEIRKTELALKYIPRDEIQPEELAFKQGILYRVVLRHSVNKGDVITLDMVSFLRTDRGIDARDFDKAGNTGLALRDLSAGLIPIDGIKLNS